MISNGNGQEQIDRNKIDRNKHKLDWYILAVLYPTYENVKKGLSISYDPNSVSEDDIEDFMYKMRPLYAKYTFMSMLLAGDYSFLDSQDGRKP